MARDLGCKARIKITAMGVAWDKKAGVLSQHPGCAKGAGAARWCLSSWQRRAARCHPKE